MSVQEMRRFDGSDTATVSFAMSQLRASPDLKGPVRGGAQAGRWLRSVCQARSVSASLVGSRPACSFERRSAGRD